MNNKKRVISILLVLLTVISVLCSATAYADKKETPVQAAKHAVVRVYAKVSDVYIKTGSAFGVGKSGSTPEYFVTNAHNCLDDNGKLVKDIYILLDNSAVTMGKNGLDEDTSKMVKCTVVNKDTISLYPDVAVLKAAKPISGRTTLKLYESSEDLKEAQPVHALGFPGDMDEIQADSASASTSLVATVDDVFFTSGTVAQKMKSAKNFGNTDLISHTAQVAHGNSGGPLIDEDGNVVGINTYAFLSGQAGTDGNYYFAVYIDYAIDILKDNKIDFVTVKSGGFDMEGKSIALIIAIVLIIAVALLLILNFQKKKNEWITNKNEEEAKELRLQGISGVFAGRRFALEKQVSIGRAPGNSIVFPTQTKGVSANHCIVYSNNGQIYVKDVGSSNGTFLNATTKLPVNQMVSVKVGDRISLGSENETFMITYKGGKV